MVKICLKYLKGKCETHAPFIITKYDLAYPGTT